MAVVAAGVTLKVVFGVEGGREGRTDGSDIPVFARATAAASFFTSLARADPGHVLSPTVRGSPHIFRKWTGDHTCRDSDGCII